MRGNKENPLNSKPIFLKDALKAKKCFSKGHKKQGPYTL